MLTPAGVRQEYPVHHKPVHLTWTRNSAKGLTYLVADEGPLRQWLNRIGRSDDALCPCGQVQNAAHMLKCTEVGDGKGRSLEEAYMDGE